MGSAIMARILVVDDAMFIVKPFDATRVLGAIAKILA
jgi:hypothetical protein